MNEQDKTAIIGAIELEIARELEIEIKDLKAVLKDLKAVLKDLRDFCESKGFDISTTNRVAEPANK